MGDAIVAAIVERPILISAAAAAYYQQVGGWPSSACDLEEFGGEDFLDIDWASLEDTIVFEELPDGGLKIISTDPHYQFTLTTDIPSDQQEDATSEGNQEEMSLVSPEFLDIFEAYLYTEPDCQISFWAPSRG